MSFCKSISEPSRKRGPATRTKKAATRKVDDLSEKASGGNSTRRFFHIWKRRDSDQLRQKILKILGYTSASSPYETLLSLPEVSPFEALEQYTANRQALSLFSKDEDMISPIDKQRVALESFLDSEKSCALVNKSFRDNCFASGDAARILFYAQRKIATILGDVPDLDALELQFGSGASTSCSKQKVSARWKLSEKPSISQSAVTSLRDLMRALPKYFQFHQGLEIHNGRLDFVPKNYKTLRSICIEPTVNGMVQRGIGTVLKQKMLRAGINLYDQTINRGRARSGSLTGALGTLDLEKASDSVSYHLVMELLPWEWFCFLDAYRTPIVEYRGTTIRLEKFSSMGNGYTFELESLIFYSLAYGIARVFEKPFDLTVYGDDLICNVQLCHLIIKWFPTFGFTVNTAKSYVEGPFRESCGGDFVNGVDVRPFYLKGRFSYHKVVCFYNFLMRKEHFDRSGEIRTLLLSMLPLEYRLYGPDGFGDGHLLVTNPNDYLIPYQRQKGYAGFTFQTFVSKPKRLKDRCIGDELLPSYFASTIKSLPIFKRDRDDRIVPNPVRTIAPDHFSVRRMKDDEALSKIVSVYVLNPF